MKPTTIKKLIELVEDSSIDVLEVRSWWRTVKITRQGPASNGSAPAMVAQTVAPQVAVAPLAPAASSPPVQAEAEPDNLTAVKSPMVGTFYTAPSPESPVFVKVGDSVGVGTVVCIVEAMKLMNEIEAEVGGRIAKILVENGQPVEFGQPLFLIDTSA